MGFAVPELPSGRESFSPDAAYYDGLLPADDMDFVPGPPTLAVEVRSKTDYGDAAEDAMAAKRVDYFLAGTQVVWDVDPRLRMHPSLPVGGSPTAEHLPQGPPCRRRAGRARLAFRGGRHLPLSRRPPTFGSSPLRRNGVRTARVTVTNLVDSSLNSP